VTTMPPQDSDPQRESMEQIVALPRGPQGEQGNAGAAGARGRPGTGLPKAQRQAITWMFAFCVVLVVATFLGLFHYAGALAGQQHVVARQERALDRQQRELDDATAASIRQRCISIEQDATIPITHPIAGNPSREWEAAYEAIDRRRGVQLHCKAG
jgi:hypothetical protein